MHDYNLNLGTGIAGEPMLAHQDFNEAILIVPMNWGKSVSGPYTRAVTLGKTFPIPV